MPPSSPISVESGGLRFDLGSGYVENGRGDATRLGPVNTRVLKVLLDRAGQIVTRNEFFDEVWGNQVVGEDALTRCVSDIRTEIRKLAGGRVFIETLPKRGYRWVEDVSNIPAAARGEYGAGKSDASDVTSTPAVIRGLRRSAVKGLVYLLALAAMASALVWTIDQLAEPPRPVVAVLPLGAPASLGETAASVEARLIDLLVATGGYSVLSRSAIDSRPANPFPYFYFEFGARWVIEGELREPSQTPSLTFTLVDARTGISLARVTHVLGGSDASIDTGVRLAFERIEDAIHSELAD